MERNGYPEETYYTFSYSPIPADDGTVGGIFCANTDDTQRVIGERQLDAAARTGRHHRRTRAPGSEACERSARALATDPQRSAVRDDLHAGAGRTHGDRLPAPAASSPTIRRVMAYIVARR